MTETAMPAGAGMTPGERRAVGAMALIYGARMLGLFMLLPVLSLYADTLAGATPFLVGVSVGAYGITQACLQIPFGLASDRFGRRRVVLFGLFVFAAGGVLAASAEHIAGVIAGRALQGAGAISAVLTALVADLTRDAVRTRAMAIIGASIGLSFLVSLIAGPALGAWLGVDGLFWITACLAVLAAGVLLVAVAPDERRHVRAAGGWLAVLRNPRLLELDFGIFSLHFILAALFVALPFVLRDAADLPAADHWRFYLLVILISIAGTILLIRRVERASRPALVVAAAVLTQVVGLGLLAFGPQSLTGYGAAMVIFFAGFNFLEARLPAEVSARVSTVHRGAALGIYASAQFLGIFAGGSAAGALLSVASPRAVFLLGAGLAALWLASRLHLFRSGTTG